MKNYSEKFKVAYNNKIEQQKEYLQDRDLMGKAINSVEHPNYFKFDTDWKEIRNNLDAPLLKDAYYKIGDKVLFVKKNTFNYDYNIPIPKDSLKRKGWFSYTIFDKTIEDVDIHHPLKSEMYYKNELSIGFISEVKTSDDGSGEILYLLKNVIPTPPESNPCILEKDIITINEDSLAFIESLLIYMNKNNDNN